MSRLRKDKQREHQKQINDAVRSVNVRDLLMRTRRKKARIVVLGTCLTLFISAFGVFELWHVAAAFGAELAMHNLVMSFLED